MGKEKKKSHQKQHLRQKCPKWGRQKKQSFRSKEGARDRREVNTAFLKKKKKDKFPTKSWCYAGYSCGKEFPYLHPSWIAIPNPFAIVAATMAWSSHCCLMACGKDGCLENFSFTAWIPREENVNGNCTGGIQCGKDVCLLPDLYLFHKQDIGPHCNSGDHQPCWNSSVRTQSISVLASVTSNNTSS